MLAIGVAGTLAVVATIWIGREDQASNAKDVQSAIARMADIATAMQNEKPLLERQANAAADSAAAAKETAGLAKGQTNAIVRQANALIGSAQSTVRAAEAQLAAAQANARSAEASADAAKAQRQSAELLAATRAPVARLSSLEFLGWDNAPDAKGLVKFTVKPNYTNIGGGTLQPGITTFSLLITDTIDDSPPPRAQRGFGGNENPIPPGRAYYPLEPFEYALPKTALDAASARKMGIIVWGEMNWSDVPGKPYKACYLATIEPPNPKGPGGAVRLLDVPAYRCGESDVPAIK